MSKFKSGDIIETSVCFITRVYFYYLVLKVIKSDQDGNLYSVYCFRDGRISSIFEFENLKDLEKVEISELFKD